MMIDLPHLVASSMERAPWGWVLTATVIIGLIKIWPAMSKLAIEERAAKRKEKREAQESCEERLDALGVRLDEIFARSHDFEMKLVGTIAAYKILDAHVEATDPQSGALKQSRSVMSTTFQVSPSTQGAPRSQPVVEIRTHGHG